MIKFKINIWGNKEKITHKNIISNIKTLQKIRPVKKQIKQIK